jgi:TM2 domain-containing membrane protein YozV
MFYSMPFLKDGGCKMKKKSKFRTFILSMVPGLGHIYLGFSARGCIFLAAFAGVPVIMETLMDLIHFYAIDSLLVVPMVVIWLASMLDSMILTDRINGKPNLEGLPENPGSIFPDYNLMLKQNKKVLAMLLSIIPGAGHLYLGLQRQGIELMAFFFLSFYLTDWLKISIFMVVAPIVWFASMFDVMHKASGERPMVDNSILSDKWFKDEQAIISENSLLRNKHKFLGYALIILGTYLILNRFVYPFILSYLDSRIADNIQTGFVAVLLIIGGVKVVLGSKAPKVDSETEPLS